MKHFLIAVAVFMFFMVNTARAEPYLAIQQGLKCASCHVNPTGGGLRNKFGNAFAQTQLAADTINTGDELWLGSINQRLSVGGDARAAAIITSIPNNDQTREFEVEQVRLYLDMAIIPSRLSLYIDELVAPGASINREAYIHYITENGQWHVKAGQMYLPFGLRLQDDSAYIRQIAGINMSTPDTGVELDWEHNAWSTQLAISNGSASGTETDTGKQYSTQAAYVHNRWRVGAGANFNDSEGGDRKAYALFAGLRTGPIAWLSEVDYVIDDIPANTNTTPDQHKSVAGLLEGNWRIAKGHNLKITAEEFDPDREIAHDNQARWSAVYEYSPFQFMQLRTGTRYYDGIPQSDLQNRRLYFLELHAFF
jgi:Phosphate-selective porin O and P